MWFALRAMAGMALASTASGMALARSTGGLRALSTLRGGATGKEVLVTGGVGYIGSHTVLELLRADYRVVIVDNLCNSNLECLKRVQELAGKEATFYEADIRDKSAMAAVFAKHDVGAVIHFAGLKAVGESVAKPQLYYEVNVQGTLVLLEVMSEAGCGDMHATQGSNPELADVSRDHSPHATARQCIQAGSLLTRVSPALDRVFSSSATLTLALTLALTLTRTPTPTLTQCLLVVCHGLRRPGVRAGGRELSYGADQPVRLTFASG